MNLDFNIANFISDLGVNCSKVQMKDFNKGDVITTYIAKRNQLCLIVSGGADLVRYDFNGNRTIVEHFSSNDIFGEIFYTVNTNNELFVEARENSTVYFLIFDEVQTKCRTNCKFHEKLIHSFPNLFLNQIIELNTRIEILTKRTIRDKLISYFTITSTRNLSKTFKLPFSLTDLADYLSVDRSAMMREISLLKDDGIIEKSGNRITLLSQ